MKQWDLKALVAETRAREVERLAARAKRTEADVARIVEHVDGLIAQETANGFFNVYLSDSAMCELQCTHEAWELARKHYEAFGFACPRSGDPGYAGATFFAVGWLPDTGGSQS